MIDNLLVTLFVLAYIAWALPRTWKDIQPQTKEPCHE